MGDQTKFTISNTSVVNNSNNANNNMFHMPINHSPLNVPNSIPMSVMDVPPPLPTSSTATVTALPIQSLPVLPILSRQTCANQQQSQQTDIKLNSNSNNQFMFNPLSMSQSISLGIKQNDYNIIATSPDNKTCNSAPTTTTK